MEYISEALPEFVIVFLLTGAFFWLSKDKLSQPVRLKAVLSVLTLGAVWLVLLAQSDSMPKPLQVSEAQPNYEQPLADVSDKSPETLSSEESSQRLKQLRDAQKQGSSLVDNEDHAEDKEIKSKK